ncbi:MAG: DUF2206 domain-containing protein [Elusimicrobiota bacterium]|nr:DUF2206 domain-containing protein [Endomicrobiia bacterium]MDW8166254.1 DUF2206 domain-containing protein [Elusimicrobiota bacterium]
MKIIDFFQANDWEIKKFLKMVALVQFIVLILVFLDFENFMEDFRFYIVRQIVVFVYLTFIPGLVILRILRMHNLGSAKTLCYSVGLSLAIITFLGLFVNTFYPIFRIKPITILPLILTFTIVVFLLCLGAYIRDKDFYREERNIEIILSPKILFLLFLPFLTILGVFILEYYGINFILLTLIIFISFILVFHKSFLNTAILAVWVISLSLLLHNSMVSEYIRLSDNVGEIKFITKVINDGHWNPDYPHHLYTMPAITLLLPIYVIFTNLNVFIVYKIFVPFLYSIVSIVLFLIYNNYTRNNRIAFLAVFFFISFYEFYTWAGITAKVTLSGLFLSLFLLSIFYKENKLISIIFASLIVLSHYGTAYIILFIIIFSYIFAKILKEKNFIINLNLIVFIIIFSIAWYLYTSHGLWFESMINLGSHIITSVFDWIIIPEESYINKVALSKISLSLEILKILIVISGIFLLIGLTGVIIKNRKIDSYELLSLGFVLLLGVLFIGFASGAATPDRIFHLSSYLLSPFVLIGYLSIIGVIKKFIKKFTFETPILIFLIVFLLVNVGFISETLTKDFPGASVVLSKNRLLEKGNLAEKEYIGFIYTTKAEATSIKWLKSYYDANIKVLTDHTGLSKFAYFGFENASVYRQIVHYLEGKQLSYLYISNFNIREKILSSKTLIYSKNLSSDTYLINYAKVCYEIIYSNANSAVYVVKLK